jgi:hypothetical protein
MTHRFASRIDAHGIVNVAIDEIADEAMDHYFEEHPEMLSVVAIPTYWCAKYGYWPNPPPGWTIYQQDYPI